MLGETHVTTYRRIQGLCISPDSRIWVAMDVSDLKGWLHWCAVLTVPMASAVSLHEGLRAAQLLCLWSIDTHKHWPHLFRAIVRELLVGCLAQQTHAPAVGEQMLLRKLHMSQAAYSA